MKQIFNHFQQCFFDSLVNNRLVYNSCWEDPRIDRQLLHIDRNSRVITLTSAGCNALDYLLDEPESICCIDKNPAQNALLRLKITLYWEGDHQALWNLFSGVPTRSAYPLYHRTLRHRLPEFDRQFWDRHIDYFLPSASPSSFYFRGTSGAIAYLVYRHIRHKGLYSKILDLLDSKSLFEQRYHYDDIEPELWNWFSRWLVSRQATLSMLGIPQNQKALIENETEGGIASFIQRSIRTVFREQPIHENYFWRVYLTGSYTPHCCPNYLKPENFDSIRDNIDKIKCATSSLGDYLERHPGRYSHFILLDHQDWLASHQPKELNREWRLILSNACRGAKILFRSASTSRTFVPGFVEEYLQFENHTTDLVTERDRVGTYGSTHLATVIRRYE